MRTSLAVAAFAALGIGTFAFGAGPQLTGHHNTGGHAATGAENAQYLIDDATSDDSVGLNSTTPNDVIWLNTFPKIAGAEKIVSVDVVFGTPLFPGGATNGTPIRVLLYDDANGGDPSDGTLLANVAGGIQNADTNNFAVYAMPGGGVVVPSGNLSVGVLIPSAVNPANPFPAGLDETDPDLAGRSWIGFAGPGAVNPANLAGTIPAANRGFIESFGLPGNWMVRADGVAAPEPTSLALLGLGGPGLIARRRRA